MGAYYAWETSFLVIRKMQIETTRRCCSTFPRMVQLGGRQEQAWVGMWRKWKHHTSRMATPQVTAALEHHAAISEKLKHRLTRRWGFSTPRNQRKTSENVCSHKDLLVNVHIRSSLINKRAKLNPGQMSFTGQWINRTSHIPLTKYYVTIKRNEILITFLCEWTLETIS